MFEPNTLDALELEGLENANSPARYPLVNEKALLRRIDFKVLPMLFLVYVAAFLDR